MSSTANNLVHEVREEFLSKNANLLALAREGASAVMKRVAAAMALDSEMRGEVSFFSDADYLDQKDYHARRDARETFKREMYRAVCQAFCRVHRNARIEFVAALTPEAEAELEAIEVTAGVRTPAPPPPPQPSAQELLEDEVRSDWNGGLSSDEIKKKLQTNREYKAVFDKLMDANQLESIATSYVDGSAEFRR